MNTRREDSRKGLWTPFSTLSVARFVSSVAGILRLADLLKQRIAVLGFAFKADTGDTRESAAITLIRDFQSEKAFVNIYDPQVPRDQIWMDLQEASPHLSIETSMPTSPFHHILI